VRQKGTHLSLQKITGEGTYEQLYIYIQELLRGHFFIFFIKWLKQRRIDRFTLNVIMRAGASAQVPEYIFCFCFFFASDRPVSTHFVSIRVWREVLNQFIKKKFDK
jgi:hypothetical protein